MSPFAFDATVADFDEKVIAASHNAPVLVDFWAEWCSPCRTLKPILEKLAAEYGGRFLLAKVDSDHNQPLAARYGVRGIPAVKAFHKGELVDEFTGALPESQVRAFLDRLIPSPAEPLRLAAQQARLDREFETARSLLADALAIDPHNDGIHLDCAALELDAGDANAAAAALQRVTEQTTESARRDALQTRIKLLTSGASADIPALEQRLANNPDDHAARLDLANAQALAGDYRAALDNLLDIVRRDRKWNDEAARRRMLDLFQLMAAEPALDDLLRSYRIVLARTLN
jgi:putative thioredoxin